jgi:hypothetical protein
MNGRNTGTSRAVGCRRALGPVEQSGERRLQAVPDLLDRFDSSAEALGQRLLGEPRVDPDAQRAERELEQRETARASRWSSIAASTAAHPSSTPSEAARSHRDSDRRIVDLGGSPCGRPSSDRFRRCRRHSRGSCRTARVDPLFDQPRIAPV